MKLYSQSRRQDLLIGSLVTTVMICTAAWLSTPQRITAAVRPPAPPMTKDFPMPPPDADETRDMPDSAAARAPAPDTPPLPQQPDIPRPEAPGPFTQAAEPPVPYTVDSSVIRNIGQPGGSGHHRVWDPSALDQLPTVRYQAKPQYPYDLRKDGITGEVVVDFIVDPEGRVRNASVIRSTNRDFEGPALDAVSRWRFHAGSRGGVPVFTHMVVPIEFRFEDR
jgi:protein TonB